MIDPNTRSHTEFQNAPIHAASTVGQIVAAGHQTARVFEALGIDYCCAGSRSLAGACEAAGLDVASVVAQLGAAMAAPPSEPDWTASSMTELADHIEQTHHEYLRRELPRVTMLLKKVLAAHGGHRAELGELRVVFTAFCRELFDHMLKEERMLFPWLRRLESGSRAEQLPGWSVRGPVSCMVHEHDEAGRALARMRELTGGFVPPEGACATYRALYASLAELEQDMHRHVHKENSILFPKALRAEAEGESRADRPPASERYQPPARPAPTTEKKGDACACDHRIDA